jgi:hypothetical protein
VRWHDFEWEAWRPDEVARRLASLEVPWYVAGGWAIDLFLGGERREHEDLEIGVPSERFLAEVAPALSELELYVTDSGQVTPLGDAAARLPVTHQTWGLDRGAGVWRIDVFREPGRAGEWICRRDDRIRLRYGELIERTPDGIPYARPEVVLLFKARSARPKDEADLAAVLPRLGAARRHLLAGWIEQVHPGHFWLPELAG